LCDLYGGKGLVFVPAIDDGMEKGGEEGGRISGAGGVGDGDEVGEMYQSTSMLHLSFSEQRGVEAVVRERYQV
jgi:hypothetical protein